MGAAQAPNRTRPILGLPSCQPALVNQPPMPRAPCCAAGPTRQHHPANQPTNQPTNQPPMPSAMCVMCFAPHQAQRGQHRRGRGLGGGQAGRQVGVGPAPGWGGRRGAATGAAGGGGKQRVAGGSFQRCEVEARRGSHRPRLVCTVVRLLVHPSRGVDARFLPASWPPSGGTWHACHCWHRPHRHRLPGTLPVERSPPPTRALPAILTSLLFFRLPPACLLLLWWCGL